MNKIFETVMGITIILLFLYSLIPSVKVILNSAKSHGEYNLIFLVIEIIPLFMIYLYMKLVLFENKLHGKLHGWIDDNIHLLIITFTLWANIL